MKNGILLQISNDNRSISEEDAVKEGLSINSAVLSLRIDVNGADKPNINARDRFVFLVGNDGILYPAGSKVYSLILSGKVSNVYTKTSGNWPCTGSKRSIGCTARLVENNFVVDY